MHKTVTAVTLAGYPLVLFDNVAVTFGWPSLDGAVTGETWSARILGQSKMTGSLPLASTWFCTGNNLIFGSDVIRRVLHIRLHTNEENPENRADFKHPNLVQWVKQERPRLAAAAVTILRSYFAAGCPTNDLPVWGSFETWSLIRDVIVWLGMPDPALTRQELKSSDQAGGALRQVIAGWEEADSQNRGMTVKEVLQKLEFTAQGLLTGGDDPLRALRAAIGQLIKPGKDPSQVIGMRLHHMKGRICGGKFLKREDGGYGTVWSIGFADSSSGTKGTTGTNLTPINTRETILINADASGGVAAVGQTSPFSPPSPGLCQHQYDRVVDSPNGRKKECSKCGKFYGYVKESA